MGLQFIQVLVIRQICCKMLITAERIQINEHRISFHLSRILHPQVIGIRKHGHDFLLYLILGIRQVYAVSKGFAHFSLAVYTGQTQTRLIVRQKDIRLHQGIPVNTVELMDDFPGLLNHGRLVLTYRNRGRLKGGNVRCLADWVCEEAHRNAGLKVAHLNLGFYGRIALKPGYGHQIHIVKRHLAQLRHL